LADKADPSLSKNNGGVGAVDIIIRVKVGFVFVHKKKVEAVFFAGTTGVACRAEVGTVDTSPSIISGDVIGK